MNWLEECCETLSSEHGITIASMVSKQLLLSARTVMLQDRALQYPIMDGEGLVGPHFLLSSYEIDTLWLLE